MLVLGLNISLYTKRLTCDLCNLFRYTSLDMKDMMGNITEHIVVGETLVYSC
jgi:hypothetical protein